MSAKKKSKKLEESPANVEDLVGEQEEVVIDPDYPAYTSGVVCDLLEVTPWFLKQIDDEGLVSPPRDNENATRLYSKNELDKVAYVNKLMAEQNLNLEGVKLVLQLQGETIDG
ncbi:MAG: MerR family transcriptional regulator [Candidatus Melainabacteria bacterium]|nr:MerR family transcriptional regulator [Candidatus Melainabacteria bacterium]